MTMAYTETTTSAAGSSQTVPPKVRHWHWGTLFIRLGALAAFVFILAWSQSKHPVLPIRSMR